MNNKFYFVYTVNKRWIENMFWMNVTSSQLFLSAIFPVSLFVLAWLLQAKWIKLICILAGLGLILFFLVQVKKYAKASFDSFSGSFERFAEYQVETTIENDEVKYTLKHKGKYLRTASVSLAKCTQFSRYKGLVAVKEVNTSNVLYFYGTPSKLQRLTIYLEERGLIETPARKNMFGKLVSIGIIALSFALSVYSFFSS